MDTKQINEGIVYIARKLHWSLKDIGELSPGQFVTLLNELYYQESVDKYEQYSIINTLLSEIHNAPISKPKIRRPKDYYQLEMPLRHDEPRKKKQSDAQMLAQVQALNAALGGDVVIKESSK